MDYEILMNGNVKIGTYAPDFEAKTTIRENGWFYFHTHGDFTPVKSESLDEYMKTPVS